VESGWHLYSASERLGRPTSFKVSSPVADAVRVLQLPPKRTFDPNFNGETETYEGDIAFLVELQLKKDAPFGPAELKVNGSYQTCNDRQCVPGKWEKSVALTIDPSAPSVPLIIPADYVEAKPQARAAVTPQDQGLLGFLAVAFGFGLASIFTPCVFPMIPITMSYFLNRQAGRRDAVVQAVIFCVGVVVLFSGLGLATSAILGPAGVKQLGASPWVNGFITLLFIAFGLSLLGAFEITIPSSILTKLNQSSNRGGAIGTLLMGLTFSLSSFACVGPFVGTLLAGSVGGGAALRPLLGMVTFGAGLALPFFVLALFPSYLKRMPRSGGWLARVKVVMGFVIIAASLKYLASVDLALQWGILTRSRFLAAWIVLFAMAGLYLLGFLRLEGVKPDETLGLGRLLIGMVFLILALSLIPGMSGGRLGDLDAYVPAADQASVGGGASTGLVWMTDQYRAALEKAKREGKLLFIDFTGVACGNCHWMRANMFTKPEIESALANFVLVELYTDRGDAVSEENLNLELTKFKNLGNPFYAILDGDENVIATFDHLTKEAQEFLAFIQKGQKPTAAASASEIPQLTRLEGGPLDTASLAGKVVVVDFWATYCVPCIKEIPMFNKLQAEYGPKGLVVIGASQDEEGAEKVKPFLKAHPMNYTVALGSPALGEKYKLDALPVTLVFDRKGKQVQRFEGFTPEEGLLAALQKAI
jgi:thiol:disulfide interchange protein DsbD